MERAALQAAGWPLTLNPNPNPNPNPNQAAGWLFASEGVCVHRDHSRRASLRIVQRYPFSSELRRSATIAALEQRGPARGPARGARAEAEAAARPRLSVLAKVRLRLRARVSLGVRVGVRVRVS